MRYVTIVTARRRANCSHDSAVQHLPPLDSQLAYIWDHQWNIQSIDLNEMSLSDAFRAICPRKGLKFPQKIVHIYIAYWDIKQFAYNYPVRYVTIVTARRRANCSHDSAVQHLPPLDSQLAYIWDHQWNIQSIDLNEMSLSDAFRAICPRKDLKFPQKIVHIYIAFWDIKQFAYNYPVRYVTIVTARRRANCSHDSAVQHLPPLDSQLAYIWDHQWNIQSIDLNEMSLSDAFRAICPRKDLKFPQKIVHIYIAFWDIKQFAYNYPVRYVTIVTARRRANCSHDSAVQHLPPLDSQLAYIWDHQWNIQSIDLNEMSLSDAFRAICPRKGLKFPQKIVHIYIAYWDIKQFAYNYPVRYVTIVTARRRANCSHDSAVQHLPPLDSQLAYIWDHQWNIQSIDLNEMSLSDAFRAICPRKGLKFPQK